MPDILCENNVFRLNPDHLLYSFAPSFTSVKMKFKFVIK